MFVLAPTKTMCAAWVRRLEAARLPFLAERGGASPLSRESSKALVRALIDLRARREPDPDDLSSLVDALPVRGTDFLNDVAKSALVEIAGGGPLLGYEAEGLKIEALLEAPSLADAAAAARLGDEDCRLAAIAERWGREILEVPPRVRVTTFHGSKGREAELVVVDCSEVPFPVKSALARGAADGWRRAIYVAYTRSKDKLVVVGAALENALCPAPRRPE